MSQHRVSPDAGWVDPRQLPRGPNGRALCRCGCGREVGKGRRTFYSEACVEAWRLKTDPGFVRDKVWQRDHGICARCGLDTEEEQKRLQGLWVAWRNSDYRGRRVAHEALQQALQPYGLDTPCRSLWEAHHVKPVSEGGGECGLDGYETLCLKCHKRETREWHRAKARERRAAKRVERDAVTGQLALAIDGGEDS